MKLFEKCLLDGKPAVIVGICGDKVTFLINGWYTRDMVKVPEDIQDGPFENSYELERRYNAR